MSQTFTLSTRSLACRLPGDNVAIAIRRLGCGQWRLKTTGSVSVLSHTVMEGHRFATRGRLSQRRAVAFLGIAVWLCRCGTIEPGEYVCKQGMLDALESARSSSRAARQAQLLRTDRPLSAR